MTTTANIKKIDGIYVRGGLGSECERAWLK